MDLHRPGILEGRMVRLELNSGSGVPNSGMPISFRCPILIRKGFTKPHRTKRMLSQLAKVRVEHKS